MHPRLETKQQIMAHIESKSIPVPECGCMIWLGRLNWRGYGRIQINGRNYPVHRVTYEAAKGPVPDGKHLDHLCRVRSCWNPEHLEPVTPRDNVLRGIGRSAVNARKTHCLRGHELTPDNLLAHSVGRGARSCKQCAAIRETTRIKSAGPRGYLGRPQSESEKLQAISDLIRQGWGVSRIAYALALSKKRVTKVRAVLSAIGLGRGE